MDNIVLLAELLFCLTTQISWCCCHPIAFDYLLADLSRCKTVKPNVLIWVQGRATDPQQRAMIRETMSNPKLWPNAIKVMTVFIVGREPIEQKKHKYAIKYEFEMYRDIVQVDFKEHYRNQSYKMISAINYVADYCEGIQLILRLDDDVIFHPSFMLKKLIYSMTANTTGIRGSTLEFIPPATIACHLIDNFAVWRKKDHPKHFNAVDDTVLPGEEMYPPFCAGFFVAMSGDVPKLLQPHIATNPPFWMDDRYMGVLQKRASIDNIAINSILDFGYKSITRNGMNALSDRKIISRHLPGKLKHHILELFIYLNLASLGFQQHFENIEYKKR